MPLITLTTEWRPDDIYYGIIRGKLASRCPGVSVIDNAFSVPAFNISHASFVVRNTFINYPEGSVHIICVRSEPHGEAFCLAARARNHFFIAPDNGILNLILNGEPEEVVRVSYDGVNDELEIFSRAAAAIVAGKELKDVGKPVQKIEEHVPLRATIDKDVVIGSVIFIDSYGNAISNITREVFYRVFENKPYRILIQSNKNYTDKISGKYSDVPVGELLTRFNSIDLLEIAINGANVSELLSLSTGSAIRIDSPEKKARPDRLF